VSALGERVPLYCIFKTDPTEEFLDNDLDPEVRFAKSATAFSSAQHTLDWMKLFNVESFKLSLTFRATGYSFKEWFGCDEHGRTWNNNLHDLTADAGARQVHKRLFRVLLIDGFSGHCDPRVHEYCEAFDILIQAFPPHGTAHMQPLDVGVFSAFKAQHQKTLREYVQAGNYTFTRVDFLRGLKVSCPLIASYD